MKSKLFLFKNIFKPSVIQIKEMFIIFSFIFLKQQGLLTDCCHKVNLFLFQKIRQYEFSIYQNNYCRRRGFSKIL